MFVTRPVPFAIVVNTEVTMALVVDRLVTSKTVVKELVIVCVVTHVEREGDTVVFVTGTDPLEDCGVDILGVLAKVETVLVWKIEFAVVDEMPVVVGRVVCVRPERVEEVLAVNGFCVLVELVGINIESIWWGIDLRIMICKVVPTIVLVTP